ncbi:uncharacterized protein LOC142236309 [Haematobia irritans]|uniref:uncharacterized protein LOC142236309 n=1 Tax=Haematobia irritans TaxID=7368 RepID=UPI003F4FD6CA
MGKGFETILAIISKIECNMDQLDKPTLSHVFKIFLKLDYYLRNGYCGIHEIVLKWCKLFTEMQSYIDPRDSTVMYQYEKVAVCAITYIIGYLQSVNADDADYHHNLLQILDSLLDNLSPKVLKKCQEFEPGTIGMLWKPLEKGVDYKTQLLTLKVYAILMKYIDESKWKYELEVIEENDNNDFKDKLINVLKVSAHQSAINVARRDLLNTYNEQIKKNVDVYSLICQYIHIPEKYEMFKRLNSEYFWLDLNFKTKSISFEGRLREESTLCYRNITCSMRFKNIEMKPFGLYIKLDEERFDDFLIITKDDNFHVYLPKRELERIQTDENLKRFAKRCNEEQNDFVENFNTNENIFDLLKYGTPICVEDSNVEHRSNTTSNPIRRKSLINLIYSPQQEINDSQKNLPLLDIVTTPLSSRKRKYQRRSHAIKQLFSNRKKRTNCDEDYDPNKRLKRDSKKRRRTTYIKNTSAKHEKSIKANISPLNDYSIMRITPELMRGFECTILNSNDIGTSVDMFGNTEESIEMSRNQSKMSSINSEDIPNLRDETIDQNCSMDIYIAQSIPQTPNSICTMDISEIFDSSFFLNGISPQLQSLTGTSEMNISKIQNELLFSNSSLISLSDSNKSYKAHKISSNLESEMELTGNLDKLKSPQNTDHTNSIDPEKLPSLYVVCQRIDEFPILLRDSSHDVEVDEKSPGTRTNSSQKAIKFYKKKFQNQLSKYSSNVDKTLKELRKTLSNSKAKYKKQQAREMTEYIVQESKEQRMVINYLIENVERLMRDMELQRQNFIYGSMQITSFQINVETFLNSLNKSTNFDLGIIHECEEIIKQFIQIKDSNNKERCKITT